MREKTVFIVGAGASEEAGLPFGRGFLDELSNKLNFQIRNGSLVEGFGDADILDAIQEHAQDRASINGYLAAARRIREGIPFSKSIDTFMDAHREDEKVQLLGKLAIAKTILEYEQKSCMYISDHSPNFLNEETLVKTWFANLARGLNDGIRRDQVGRIFEKVSFIVFNYDRCVEHFLRSSIRKYYDLSDGEVQSVLKTLVVLHPYGAIAGLPWQNNQGLPFGFPTNRPNLLMMARHIKTFTERIEDSTTLEAIKREFSEATILVFLGFSYDELNMKILDPGTKCVARSVFGTACGFSEHDVEEIKGQLRLVVRGNLTEHRMRGSDHIVRERLHIRPDLKCAGLLQEYSKTLFSPGARGFS
jgi:hypothetical protein